MASTTMAKRAQAMWRMRLHSAIRTALACIIIGCTTLLSPPSIARHLAFPSFSYVTAIIIVPDATLGKVLRGCWSACCATLQVMPLSMVGLWIHGFATDDNNFSPLVASVMVAGSAFLVALPGNTDLMCKRIAFAQLVIVYVDAVVHGIRVNIVMHPLRVASSTALGAVASVLALLLFFPWLAYFEVRKLYGMYAENASERLDLYIKALHSPNEQIAMEILSQAKPISQTGTKLLQSIKLLEGSLRWEKPWLRFIVPCFTDPGNGLHDIESPMKGMEIALTSCPCFQTTIIDEKLMRVFSHRVLQLLGLKLEQARCLLRTHSMIVTETEGVFENEFTIFSPESISLTSLDQPAIFFLSCIKMCINDLIMTKGSKDSGGSDKVSSKRVCINWTNLMNRESLVFACKCSISLGLAVLLGLQFNKRNGYWSGLTTAISFETGKVAIFTVANARAQGTALGSVYGVLGCTAFQNFARIRFIAMIPWIIFASILRHSKMYSTAGGDAAIIGALLILGRRRYGPPSEFAIARLTEALIGLSCFIIIELVIQPTRAATIAKNHLLLCFGTLKSCTKQIDLDSGQINGFKKKQRQLNSQVEKLQKFIVDAELEPGFWFTPFPVSCYQNLQRSLSNVVHLLYFMAYSIESLIQALDSCDAERNKIQEHLKKDRQIVNDAISSSMKCIEKTISIGMSRAFQDQPEDHKVVYDLEEGKSQREYTTTSTSNKEWKASSDFLEHSKEVIDNMTSIEGKEENIRNIIICLCSIGFCMSSLMREVKDLEKGVKELLNWEHP
ncbi:uncharacterized protein [Solanum lycopersicum]|uniref:Integral membrane bound transporter domain-containing protein n=1 Tax=Solanum lycopersicum TaxID=4081 RepID=K4D3Q6_SOLLC|nr:uncharacterized protein LOC101254551 [Solanum lycopersicum]